MRVKVTKIVLPLLLILGFVVAAVSTAAIVSARPISGTFAKRSPFAGS